MVSSSRRIPLLLLAAVLLATTTTQVSATGRQLAQFNPNNLPPSGVGGPCRYGHAARTCQEGLFCTITETDILGGSGTCDYQGVCGVGDAQGFPQRCWFNSDPQGRYVCCDYQGCDGFNPPDYSFPHCKNYGFVPPNYGVQGGTAGGSTNPPPPPPPSNPPSNPPPNNTPPSGDQGVCGSGAAVDFPTRCWFNSDPQHRYVCCDRQGCAGFNSDNLTPHCANYGFVPPNFGV